MQIPEVIIDNADFITAVFSILGALACVYLAVMTNQESHPLKLLQQICLCFLSISLVANGLYVFPDWKLISGHRPTGLLVESATAITMIVMAARGYLRFYGNGNGRNNPPENPIEKVSL